ncbi:MAG: hypothetical protein A4E24_00139 [Methanomethylovorans sp. PtaU1.Bin093]|jgi:hypothetical protein|uniref:DUF7544 domain-containing protein n=2 Tax=Methanomethylovorans TaxID=101191 RepID=UPI0009C44944|nr:hypothetical protein [Methanomethylovorans sp. PtaU1.Bin093]OPY22097.1 MAG: hypothetical protein A4E24_00139 [Methanomethylovorans sp. PtaU1.Bin093]
MDWYVIDAVGVAYERTKRCLFEPFDLWKWVKLAMILMLIGGGSGHGGNSFNSFNSFSDTDTYPAYGPDHDPGYDSEFDPFDLIEDAASAVSSSAVLAIIALIFLLVIVFMYISSVMEFVLVESLVSNNVKFWEYTRRFLGKGFHLFLIRIATLLLSLLVLAVIVLPFIFINGMPSGDHLWLSLIGGIMMIVFLLIVFVLIASVLGSFIGMSIPVAMYRNIGVVSAILEVLRKFKLDWQQIIVYWVGRAVLGIIVGIVALIAVMLALLVTLIPFLILDLIVYFLLSLVLSGSEWIVLVPLVLVEVILFIIAMALVSMPFGAFLKYHMLSFMEKWYPEAGIPFGQGIDINIEQAAVSST